MGGKYVPICALTGKQRLAARMDDHLLKPVIVNEPVRVRLRWLKEHESEHGGTTPMAQTGEAVRSLGDGKQL